MATPKSVAFHTLGCKLNFAETSSIRQRFESMGFLTSTWDDSADIYVLNTCSVTEFADRKCRAAVRKALRNNPDAKVVVIGCYAQLKPQEIASIEGVDLVLGASEKFNVHEYVQSLGASTEKGMVQSGEIRELNSFEQAFSFGDRTRTFLKVQDGCNYKCTFCTIPLARGKSRSHSIEGILNNVEKIVAHGSKEIVLTGVNIGDFGILPGSDQIGTTGREHTFLDLIKELDQVEDIERFRISSIEPNLCSDEIISFISQSRKFLPHFHMPLQSGSDEILRKMRRRYRSSLYRDRVAQIKSLMPHSCIGADVIVGFPGETEDHFFQTYEFLSSLDIAYLHVFTYSERAGTPAVNMSGFVPMEARRERNKLLRRLSKQKKLKFYEKFIGDTRSVLVERDRSGRGLTGFTDNYIKVSLDSTDILLLNQVIPVRLMGIGHDLKMNAHIQETRKELSS